MSLCKESTFLLHDDISTSWVTSSVNGTRLVRPDVGSVAINQCWSCWAFNNNRALWGLDPTTRSHESPRAKRQHALCKSFRRFRWVRT